MAKIKVVQVSSDTNIGGAGKCILTFLKNYDRARFEICAVIPKNSLLKPEMEKLGIKIYEAEHIADKSLSIKGISELRKIFGDIKPDIVHTHGAMSGRIAAKSRGIKTVFTRHSVFPPSARISKGIGKKINGFVNDKTADKIIAVAQAAKDNLTATGVCEKKIDVILNGVSPLREYTPEELKSAREKFGLADGQKSAAIVARLNTVKGHKYFVEAAKAVTDSGIDAKFFIAGTGDAEDEIREQINSLGLSERVIMLGFMDNVEPLMNVMDVQLNCSFGTEATSLSLLEGMSIGKPAVVTDFGGNPGVIEDGVNGFLVPTKNPDKMAEKIRLLLKDDELYGTLSENSRRIYKEKFTESVYTNNIEKIYLSLGGGKNGKA